MAEAAICTEIIDHASAWRGADLRHDNSWVRRFSEGELAELEAALRHAQRTGKPLAEIGRGDFPLAALAAPLAGIVNEINHGRGFVVLRGLPVARYTDEEVGLIFWGIGTHMGSAVEQNPQGDLLGHVFDHGRQYGQIDVRGYETNAHLPFHTDGSDLVGLLCLRAARSGGLSSIVSSVTVHNEILRRHPEYLAPLYRGFHYIRREAALTERPVTDKRIPVFGYAEGKLSCRLVRNQINAGAEKMGQPLAPLERAALDLLAELSYDEDLHLDMDLEPGDMQLCNNYTILHSRTEYEDWPGPGRGRHMLRLWLTLAERRPMAPGFLQQNGYQRLTERAFRTSAEAEAVG